METGELAQATINILEGSGEISDIIGSSFTSFDGFFGTIFDNVFWFWTSIVVTLLWVAALVWTIKDASARSHSFWFHLLSVFLIVAFTPFLGLLLYIAIRPQGRKWDKSPWRDTLYQNVQFCENCGEINNIQNLYCTKCGEILHTTCRECQTKFSANYDYCPNCGAPSLDE